ncbi:MAG TPA: class I SAM-dependent methyltransferase [Acidimicrobiia bacterium]|nr:class I SAM-dependent methyltransferase [Acidimicrobiia bacterium]
MTENYFGADVAKRYDDGPASEPEAVTPVVDFLSGLVGRGRALEFGIGTGRIGLPLHERGVPVDGIDLSPEMVERLKAKPTADSIRVVVGDFATTRMGATYDLVFLVFNTINNLTTQDEQLACFRNAAGHLDSGGFFVVEVGVPKLRVLPPGQRFHTHHLSVDSWSIDEYHFETQEFTSHHFALRNGELERHSIPFRYVFPEELDLMAKMAGMSRYGRWGGWRHEPFTDDSEMHVSVWRK